MPWKSHYLANLLRTACSDKKLSNKEFLALLEIEKRIKARIEDYINGHALAEEDESPRIEQNPLLVRRQLLDMYIIALIDEKLSEVEQEMIDRYIEETNIPKRIAEDIKESAMERVNEILEDMLKES